MCVCVCVYVSIRECVSVYVQGLVYVCGSVGRLMQKCKIFSSGFTTLGKSYLVGEKMICKLSANLAGGKGWLNAPQVFH